MVRLPIREWCDALGMSRTDLARRAAIPLPVVSDYDRGKRNPTLRTIARLAAAIDREPWAFLRGPRPGEGLPTAEESRRENVAWFRSLTPSQRIRAAEANTRYVAKYRGILTKGGHEARRR